MENISIDLYYCFGIKKFQTKLNFTKNTVGIYASNGLMKSSLANTFLNYENLETEYKKEPKADIKIDNNNFNSDNSLVIETFDFDLSKIDSDLEDSTNLLLNNDLKNKYDEIKKDEKEKLKKINIEKDSGYKTQKSFLNALEDIFNMPLHEIINANKDKFENPETIDEGLLKIDIKKFFVQSLKEILDDSDIKKNFSSYIEKVKSLGFFTEDFNDISFLRIKKTLEENMFFSVVGNKIIIVSKNGEERIFNSIKEVEEFLRESFNEIYQKIAEKLDGKKETEGLKEVLDKNSEILKDLEDFDSAKKKYFLYHLINKSNECLEYLSSIENNKTQIDNLKENAKEDIANWKKVLKVFHERFSLPIQIDIDSDEKLKSTFEGDDSIPKFKIKALKEDYKEEKRKMGELNFLSTGEKKSLHILRAIYDIEEVKKSEEDILIVLDDIVDSFDYKNKHAFLQYLKDLKNCKNLYFLILTHNFDFFRNLLNKDIFDGENQHIAKSEKGEIILEKFEKDFIKNPFKNLFNEEEKSGIEIVTLIACLRSIMELKGTNGENLKKLTKMLHLQGGSNDIKFNDLESIYKEEEGGKNLILEKECKNSIEGKSMYEFIIEVCKKIEDKNIKEDNLFDKIVFSIGIRLCVEKFIINKFELKLEKIENTEKEIWQKYSDNTFWEEADENKRKIFNKARISTTDYIHINTFMYEPLIDQPAENLKELFKNASNL